MSCPGFRALTKRSSTCSEFRGVWPSPFRGHYVLSAEFAVRLPIRNTLHARYRLPTPPPASRNPSGLRHGLSFWETGARCDRYGLTARPSPPTAYQWARDCAAVFAATKNSRPFACADVSGQQMSKDDTLLVRVCSGSPRSSDPLNSRI